jgi:hypothetical protein
MLAFDDCSFLACIGEPHRKRRAGLSGANDDCIVSGVHISSMAKAVPQSFRIDEQAGWKVQQQVGASKLVERSSKLFRA